MDSLIKKQTITLGGKVRTLCFDFNSICKVSEMTGRNLLQDSVSNVEPSALRALLYASLLHDDPTITLDEAGSFITVKNLAKVRETIMTAWFDSITDEESEPSEQASGEDKAQE